MLYWFMLLIEIFSCTIELTTGRKSHKLIFENLHKWTSSKQQKKISTWSCAVCAVGAAKRRSRISRVSIVSWVEEEPEEEEREKEEKYWPWRHILKQLNRNYSHLLFRSFRSFFSPLIPVCVSQQKTKSETRTQLRQQVDSSAVDSFPCVFFSRSVFGRARRAEAEAEPVSRDESHEGGKSQVEVDFDFDCTFYPSINIIWRVSNSMFVVVLCCTHNLPR